MFRELYSTREAAADAALVEGGSRTDRIVEHTGADILNLLHGIEFVEVDGRRFWTGIERATLDSEGDIHEPESIEAVAAALNRPRGDASIKFGTAS